MRLSVSSVLVLVGCTISINVGAFAPPLARSHLARPAFSSSSSTSRFMSAQPDLNTIINTFTSMTMAEGESEGAGVISGLMDQLTAPSSDAASAPVQAAVDTATATATAAAVATQAADVSGDAAQAASTAANNGWFGFLTTPIEGLIQIIHGMLVTVGLDSNAWGISIVLLTLLIKLVTFPLTKTQLESTNKMQAMQPEIKKIQAKYQSNQEVMNQKMAEFYQTNDINPLAGCLPSLVQIPVFIGLYRAVLALASANELDEPFLFLPNLEGPTYGADPAHGSDWLFGEWVNNVPPLGWDDTISFLILPVFLVISQFISMELMQPKSDDPAQQQSNVILKVLPIMIGWFALNVPAALSVYWVVNNIVTTATSLLIRNTMKIEPIKTVGSGGAASTAVQPPPTIFAPPPQKPSGFGGGGGPSTAPSTPKDAVKPITAIDAEVVTPQEPEAPAPPVAAAAADDDAVQEITAESAPPPPSQKKRKGKRGKKRKKKN